MPKKSYAVLEIGSSKISVMIGQGGVNNTIIVKGLSSAEYSGFMDGAFLEPSEVKFAVGLALSNAEVSAGESAKNIVVGLPAEFCFCQSKMVSLSFDGKKRVTEADVQELFDRANNFKNKSNYTLISSSHIACFLDDGKRVLSPVGYKSAKISTTASLIFTQTSILGFLNNCFKDLGIESVEYQCIALAEAKEFLSNDSRELGAVVISSGYLTTSVAIIRGDGLLFLSSFSLGTGHVSADLAQCFNLKFADAETLKNKIVLTLKPKSTDTISLLSNDKCIEFPTEKTNLVVESRVMQIAGAISKCLKMYFENNKPFMQMFLTGDGLSQIKGAKEVLSKELGRNIELLYPDVPGYGRPQFSALFGLIKLAIKNNAKKTLSVFAKFFRK